MTDKADASKINQSAVQKKRGRKSKKELELASQAQSAENINVVIEESACDNCDATENTVLSSAVDNTEEDGANDTNIFLSTDNSVLAEDTKPVAKKRGRKPKGGKIIQQVVPTNNNLEPKPNVILHLKCSIKDLQTNSVNGQDIQSFDIQHQAHLSYEMINPPAEFLNNAPVSNNEIITTQTKHVEDDSEPDDSNIDTKEVWKKLKALEHNLHINNICDKKSACFWCTCDFDNPPVYIPKYYVKDSYNVYGCFCSPECATAYLMEENIDSSARFERYHFLNHIYSKIYDYNKNIKPAPNPYYLLDKYYGNLSIQEYRSLLRNERLFLVVDKPLTRILPELHEDNDDFIINNKIIPSNTFQIKKKLQKKQTKTNILSDHFGLAH
jgi:hypothetical protein